MASELLERLLFQKTDSRQLAALRIALGMLTLLTLIGLVGEIDFYYTDEGWLPLKTALSYQSANEWSLLQLFTTVSAVRAFFALMILCSLALIVGFKTRIVAWACFIGIASIQSRNWMNTYGGDAVLRLLLFYLALSKSGLSWSFDRRRSPSEELAPVWPLRLMQIQIALIYGSSGLAKLHGADWVSGDAIAMMLLNPVFARWDWVELLNIGPINWGFRTVTWLTLFWEVSFPILVFWKRSRPFVLALGLLLHLGIIVFLQLHWFGHIMIASYLAYAPSSLFKLKASWPKGVSFARARTG